MYAFGFLYGFVVIGGGGARSFFIFFLEEYVCLCWLFRVRSGVEWFFGDRVCSRSKYR